METTTVLRELMTAAERFVNKAPKHARLETERQVLLDALMRAQLVLSTPRHGAAERTRKEQNHPTKGDQERTEAAALLRSLPGERAMSPRQKHKIQRLGKKGSLPPRSI
jgi:hypothetical protein